LIMRLFFEHELQLRDALSFGYLGRQGDELEILIIHDHPESLGSLHEKHIQKGDKTYKVKAHIHTSESFEKGLAANDNYFVNMLKKVFIITEKGGFLTRVKKGQS
jgi:hypothetical protein